MKHPWHRNRGYLLLPVSLALAITALAAYMIATEQSVLRTGSDQTLEKDQIELLAQTGFSQQRVHMNQLGTCANYVNQSYTLGEYTVSNAVTPKNWTPVNVTTTVTHDPTGEVVYQIARSGVPVYQGMTTQIIQPDENASKETMISSLAPTFNYGARDHMYIGASENSLIEFDLSVIPNNMDLFSASIDLYFDLLNTPGTVAVHRVTSDWVEGTKNGVGTADGATWVNRTTLLPWTLAGGDYRLAPEAVVPVDTVPRWYAFDVTRLVRGWLDGTYTNRGVLLKAEDGLDDAQPVAADVSIPANLYPKLRLAWGCECGETCSTGGFCDGTIAPVAQFDWWNWNFLIGSPGVISGIGWMLEGETFGGATVPAGGGLILLDKTADFLHLTLPDGTALASRKVTHPDPRGVARVRMGTWDGHMAVLDPTDNRVYYLDDSATIQGSISLSTILTQAQNIDTIGPTSGGLYDGMLAVTANMSMVYILGSWVATTAPGIRIINQSGTLQLFIPTGLFAPNPRGIAHIPNQDQFWVLNESGVVYRVNFAGTVLDSYNAGSLGSTWPQGLALSLENCDHWIPDDKDNRVEIYNTP